MRTLQKIYNTHFSENVSLARGFKSCAMMLGLFGVITGAPNSADAAITFLSATGASRIEVAQTATPTTPTTTPAITKPLIYAGFAGTCTATSTSEVCNSCTSTTERLPCNQTNAYPALRLTVRLDLGRTDITYDRIKAKLASNGSDLSFSIVPVVTGSVVDITLLWSELCAAIPSGDATCTKDISNQILYLGYQAAGDTTPTYYELQVTTRYIDPSNVTLKTFEICNPSSNNANSGFCNYAVKPGDGKMYLDGSVIAVASGWPATGSGSVNYVEAVVFYKANLTNDRQGTLQAISNTSDMKALSVASGTSPLTDDRIDGLTNNTDYCFVLASRDSTGIISYFAPVMGTGSDMEAAKVCGMPQEVFGLLDDKKCFIATAAFGSDMAPEVQSFREFRNKFLLTSSLGKDFVHFYYKHSPKYANIIAQNDFLRASVRAALWPVLGFAKFSTNMGLIPALAAVLSVLGLSTVAIVRLRRTRKAL